MTQMDRKKDYSDKTVLELRKLYREATGKNRPAENEIWLGGSPVAVNRVELLQGKCSMVLPEIMEDMPEIERAARYRNKNRPSVIKAVPDRTAAFTLDFYREEEKRGMPVSERLFAIQKDMGKVYKQNVFYDMDIVMAEGFPVAWMDYRAFGAGGSFYVMTFLFETGGEIFIGNFHCSFKKYDIWKPVWITLLATIKSSAKKEETDESRTDQSGAF